MSAAGGVGRGVRVPCVDNERVYSRARAHTRAAYGKTGRATNRMVLTFSRRVRERERAIFGRFWRSSFSIRLTRSRGLMYGYEVRFGKSGERGGWEFNVWDGALLF